LNAKPQAVVGFILRSQQTLVEKATPVTPDGLFVLLLVVIDFEVHGAC